MTPPGEEPPDAGHSTKLVHKSIQFGTLQAIGEGVDLSRTLPRRVGLGRNPACLAQRVGHTVVARRPDRGGIPRERRVGELVDRRITLQEATAALEEKLPGLKTIVDLERET